MGPNGVQAIEVRARRPEGWVEGSMRGHPGEEKRLRVRRRRFALMPMWLLDLGRDGVPSRWAHEML